MNKVMEQQEIVLTKRNKETSGKFFILGTNTRNQWSPGPQQCLNMVLILSLYVHSAFSGGFNCAHCTWQQWPSMTITITNLPDYLNLYSMPTMP